MMRKLSENLELHAVFDGQVQGVGFRWTVRHHAEELGLTGITRNLPDGSVEVYAQGLKEDLEALIERLKAEPSPISIKSVKIEFIEQSSPYSDFKIVH